VTPNISRLKTRYNVKQVGSTIRGLCAGSIECSGKHRLMDQEGGIRRVGLNATVLVLGLKFLCWVNGFVESRIM
jgi:hypothetical protein